MHGVGGHQLTKCREDGKIIKPTCYSEVAFYEQILPKYHGLQNLVPKYYGYGLTNEIKNIYTLNEYSTILEKGYKYYIVLENVTQYSFDEPSGEGSRYLQNINIVDIKLGKIHHTISFSSSVCKEKRNKNLRSLTETVGFRLDGALLSSYGIKYDKESCRNMNIELVKEIVNTFFIAKFAGKVTRSKFKDWITNLMLELKRINLNLYGPSILLCDYGFFLIDFAHYEELSVKNYENFLEFHRDIIIGIENLLKIL